MPSCYGMVMCSNTGAQVSKSHRKLSQVALFWLAPAAWGGRTDGSQATCGLCSSDWISKFARLRCEFAKEHVRTQSKSSPARHDEYKHPSHTFTHHGVSNFTFSTDLKPARMYIGASQAPIRTNGPGAKCGGCIHHLRTATGLVGENGK